MPCGTTGESATLDADEQRRVIAACVQAADGRVPVFAGAGTNSTERSKRLAAAAVEEGASGLLLVTPYYNRPSQEGALPPLRGGRPRRPGCPSRALQRARSHGGELEPETVFRLAELDPVVGVKEASGDLDQVMTLVRDRAEGLLVLSGDDATALAIMALGGDGLVSVAANEAPARMKALVSSALAGDVGEARRVHYELLPLMRVNFIETNPVPVKTALHLMGRVGLGCAHPSPPFPRRRSRRSGGCSARRGSWERAREPRQRRGRARVGHRDALRPVAAPGS